MDDLWQQALADVVRAELALSGRTAKDAYTALGVSSTAWQTYFKKRTRDIPSRVLLDLAAYLRMPLSELMVKTETREATLRASGAGVDELEAGLSEHGRRVLREQRERFGVPGDVADPSGRARVDVDDGLGRSASA